MQRKRPRLGRTCSTHQTAKIRTLVGSNAPHGLDRRLLIGLVLLGCVSTSSAAETQSPSTRIAIGVAVAAGMIEANDCPDYQINKAVLDSTLSQIGTDKLVVDRNNINIAMIIAEHLVDDYRLNPSRTCNEIWATLGENGVIRGVVEHRQSSESLR